MHRENIYAFLTIPLFFPAKKDFTANEQFGAQAIPYCCCQPAEILHGDRALWLCGEPGQPEEQHRNETLCVLMRALCTSDT